MKTLYLSLVLTVLCPFLSFSQQQGKSSLAVEPTAQPDSITFGNLKSYTYNISFPEASPAAENYIVLRKTGNPFISEEPVDGMTYVKGSYIGSAQVIYVGRPLAITPSFTVANTTYYFRVFSFNGSAGTENYLAANPAEDSVTTLGNMMGHYYDGLDSQSPNFMNELHLKVYPHSQLDYGQYDENLIAHFESRDTAIASVQNKVVSCAYSGYNYIYSGTFAWSVFSREHIFCQSWMPNSASNTPQYSDYHNLIPTEQNHVNGLRSNNPLGYVVNITTQYLNAKLGRDSANKTVFEPRDAQKGDDARSIFYMLICYNGAAGLEWTLPSIQEERILKLWNTLDPPDGWEVARNDYIYSIQGNRNPFVDHPEWADVFDFSHMVYIGINDVQKSPALALIYPNPATDLVFVKFNENTGSETKLFIRHISGKSTIAINGTVSGNIASVNLASLNLSKGMYILTAINGNKVCHQKIVIR